MSVGAAGGLPSAAASRVSCIHCAQRIPIGVTGDFCCSGCETVYAFLNEDGLTRFYDLRGRKGQPALDPKARRGRDLEDWVQLVEQTRAASERPVHTIECDVQGIHCAACVWVIEELFRREDASRGGTMLLNPATGALCMRVGSEFPFARFVERVERVGYRLGPMSEGRSAHAERGLLIRMVICLALAGNVMLFSLAEYAGLRSGDLHTLVARLTFALTTLAVLVGGSVFARTALSSLRSGALHFDLPITLGIGVAYVGAAVRFFVAEGDVGYLDTVTVFIALMLVGRYLQERSLQISRQRLLDGDDVRQLLTRRVSEEGAELISCADVVEGDLLRLASRALVPVAGTLEGDSPAAFSLDWIDGESEPRAFAPGEQVPAGAFNAGRTDVLIRAQEAFEEGAVLRLLRRDATHASDTRQADGDEALASTPARASDRGGFWSRVSALYVVLVIVAGAAAALAAFLRTGDTLATLEVSIAVFVVTCPCAFGIAVPLAREWANAQLRRTGVFVRRAGALDRLLEVDMVVFDKTGTLTSGAPVLNEPERIASLTEDERRLLAALAFSNDHPKSRAVQEALVELGVDPKNDAGRPSVELHPGLGAQLEAQGCRYRLGAPSWAGPSGVASQPEEAGADDLVFSRDGAVLLSLATVETLRPETGEEIRALQAHGLRVQVLSGDTQGRVDAITARLGLPKGAGRGHVRPDEKRAHIEHLQRSHRVLFVGDGLNDAPGLSAAHVAATPVVDTPFIATRCDFYLTSAGLGGVSVAIAMAQRLRAVVRLALAVALVYNLGAVAVAASGHMHPWVAAILMPSVSLFTIALTLTGLTGAHAQRGFRRVGQGRLLSWR